MKRVANAVVMSKIDSGDKKRGRGVVINKAAERSLTTKILQYSAMKIRANLPPPYSTLNPETSSDSPSAKSKGARLVSARRVTNHAINRGGIRINVGVEWLRIGLVKLKERSVVRMEINKRAIEIS